MNIRLQLTLWYTAILFLILAFFGLVVYIGLSRSLLVTVDSHLQREVGEILGNLEFESSLEMEDDGPSTETEIELKYTPEVGVFWRILDSSGRPLIDPGYFAGATFDEATLGTNQTHLENGTLANGTPIRLYTVPFTFENHGGGIVQVAESYRHVQEVQQQLVFLMALGIPLTLLAASLGGWFLAGRALGPIARITRTAQEISADDLHQRLNLKLPDDEVGQLAATFDDMLARLEDAFERQKRFIADASHEMRTPLTILKGDVEVALNRPRSADQYRETLQMVNETADRLTALVQELFLLARADNHQIPLNLKEVNLARLLAKEVAKLMPNAIKQGVALKLDAPDRLLMTADPAKLSQLFVNLIDNAIKYTGPGGEVKITVNSQPAHVFISIADTGPGISPEHMPHLFDRFYRVDKARSHHDTGAASSGAGLGLSIAQWLAHLHGGQIDLSSQMGQGSTFIVKLPLEPPTDKQI